MSDIPVRRRGREVDSRVIEVLGLPLVVGGWPLRICTVHDEWYRDTPDSAALSQQLSASAVPADVFSFILRPPVSDPLPAFHKELDNVAAVPLEGYDQWWNKQIGSKTRALVRKAAKCGVQVRTVPFDEALLRSIESIYDETPVRQGKPFWHYRKGADYLWRLHATYLDRADFIAAYLGDELVGFIKLVYAGPTANTMHIISKLAHRDKAVSNALIAKAVEIACSKGASFLVYDKFDYGIGGSETLLQFKRNNAFIKLDYPRYFVPLTAWGRVALRLGLHHGWGSLLPAAVVKAAVRLRGQWYQFRYRSGGEFAHGSGPSS